MTTIVSTLKLKMSRPEDGDWSKWNNIVFPFMRDLHAVMNGAVSQLELAQYPCQCGSEKKWIECCVAVSKHFFSKQDSSTVANPQTLCDRLVVSEWDKRIAERVARGDTASPSSAVKYAASTVVYTAWSEWRKSLRNPTSTRAMTIPSFSYGSPIPIRATGIKLVKDSRGFVVQLRLLEGRGDGAYVSVIVEPSGSSCLADTNRIFANPDAIGSAQIVYRKNPGQKTRWSINISWTREVTESTASRIMACHRGVNSFLTVAVSKGDDGREAVTATLETGKDIIEHKKRYHIRRRSLYQQRSQLGSGARGHGEQRVMRVTSTMADKEERWVDSICRKVAANAIRFAQRKDVGEIILDDWTNPAVNSRTSLGEYLDRLISNFPLAKLRNYIEWSAKKHGIKVRTIDSRDESRTCPRCGVIHDAPPVFKNDIRQRSEFRCSCGLERDVDAIASWNMLMRAGKELPLQDDNNKRKRKAGKLKAHMK